MGKGINKNKVLFSIITLALALILILMLSLKYIDLAVILTIYLPIWIIGAIAALLGKDVFANVLIAFAGIGLIAEYLIHIFNRSHPNMSGAFLNTCIIVLGLALGIIFQIISNRNMATRSKKD